MGARKIQDLQVSCFTSHRKRKYLPETIEDWEIMCQYAQIHFIYLVCLNWASYINHPNLSLLGTNPEVGTNVYFSKIYELWKSGKYRIDNQEKQ